MNRMVEALEAEVANLTRRYQVEIERGQRMLQEGLDRENPSTHLGHNLGSVANEISELAARIDQTQMFLRDLRTRIEFAEEVSR